VLAARPVSEYVVGVGPALGTMVDQLVPPLSDLSIMYPVIAEPPLFTGAVHDRSICEYEAAVAVKPVGGCGAVELVVADAVIEGELVPTLLIAETR
jgi:hypothetical protein